MVNSIADHQKVQTPDFLTYIFKYTLPFMAPMLLLVWWIYSTADKQRMINIQPVVQTVAGNSLLADSRKQFSIRQYVLATLVVTTATGMGFVLNPVLGARSTAFIFLLVVVTLALFVGRGPTLLAAALTAFSWDYFFLPPVFAFRITHLEDVLLLAMYFVVAVVLGQLTARIRRQEAIERQRTENAKAFFLLTRDLTETKNVDKMLENAAYHIENTFHAKVAVLLPDRTQRLKRYPYPAGAFSIDDRDRQVAAHVFAHAIAAGKFTETMPVTEAMFIPLSTSNETLGVVGLKFNASDGLAMAQRDLLDLFIEQIAMGVARLRLREVSEQTKILSESERLSKTLLNSVSHEIRTPIAAIKSAVSNLADDNRQLSGSQQEMIGEIQEATDRLDRVVGNVLEITRLEAGRVKPKINLCDVRDLLQVTLKETKHDLARHPYLWIFRSIYRWSNSILSSCNRPCTTYCRTLHSIPRPALP